MKRPWIWFAFIICATALRWINLKRNLPKFYLTNESTVLEFDPEPTISDTFVKILMILFFINRNKNWIFIIFGILNLIGFCFYRFYPVRKYKKKFFAKFLFCFSHGKTVKFRLLPRGDYEKVNKNHENRFFV